MIYSPDHKVIVRTCIFLLGPVIGLFYTLFPFLSAVSYLTMIVCLCWVYISLEDALRLSVPVWALSGALLLTCTLATAQQQSTLQYLTNFMVLGTIVGLLATIQYIRGQGLIGAADFFVIFALGITLRTDLLGPWILISSLVPLIGLRVKRQEWSQKIPFIPYLTASWILISTLQGG